MLEQQDMMQEMNDVLGEPMHDLDDDELMGELDELEALQAEEDLAALPQVDVQPQKQEHNILDDLPNAPVKPVKPVKSKSDQICEAQIYSFQGETLAERPESPAAWIWVVS